jgi:hypothetical protein
MQQM